MQQLIKSEVRLWAERLTQNNPHFAGLPACPFAKKAIADDRVDVRMDFGWQYCEVVRTAKHLPQRKSLIIQAELNPQMSAEKMHADIRKMNMHLSQQNIWLIGFHPDDPDPDFDDDSEDFKSLVDEPFAMIFIQRLTELDDASRVLEAQRYYTRASHEEIMELYRRRQAREEYDNGNGKKARSAGTWRKSQSI